MIIGKHFEFEAAHQLPDLPCYGKCSNLHGHTYRLTIEIEGDIKPEGWVVNFKELKELVNHYVIERYDHNNLNNMFDVPTVENVAAEIGRLLKEAFTTNGCPFILRSVVLYETATSYAKVIC